MKILKHVDIVSSGIVFLSIILALLFMSGCIKGPTNGAFLTVNDRQCTACAECERVCPSNAITIANNKAVIDPAKCTECAKCVERCPEDAIQ